jgi:hypothetical protein
VILVHVAAEIIEDTNKVAIEIGSDKFAELPRLSSGSETSVACVAFQSAKSSSHLSPAVEIEPEKDRTDVAVGLSKGAIGNE